MSSRDGFGQCNIKKWQDIRSRQLLLTINAQCNLALGRIASVRLQGLYHLGSILQRSRRWRRWRSREEKVQESVSRYDCW